MKKALRLFAVVAALAVAEGAGGAQARTSGYEHWGLKGTVTVTDHKDACHSGVCIQRDESEVWTFDGSAPIKTDELRIGKPLTVLVPATFEVHGSQQVAFNPPTAPSCNTRSQTWSGTGAHPVDFTLQDFDSPKVQVKVDGYGAPSPFNVHTEDSCPSLDPNDYLDRWDQTPADWTWGHQIDGEFSADGRLTGTWTGLSDPTWASAGESGTTTFTVTWDLTVVDHTPKPKPRPKPIRCVVPNLLGKTPDAAIALLHRNHCREGTFLIGGSGRVAKQSRKPGTILKKDAEIDFSVGRSKKRHR